MGCSSGVQAGTICIGVATWHSLLSVSEPTEAFMTWGCRIPFPASVILVFVGIWIRNGVQEAAEFQELNNSDKISKAPLKDLLRQSPVEILLAALPKCPEMIPVYIFIAFILSCGTDTLSYSRNTLLLLISAAALITAAAMICSGHYSLSRSTNSKGRLLPGPLCWLLPCWRFLGADRSLRRSWSGSPGTTGPRRFRYGRRTALDIDSRAPGTVSSMPQSTASHSLKPAASPAPVIPSPSTPPTAGSSEEGDNRL